MSQATGTGHSTMHPQGASAAGVGAGIDKNFASKDEERAARHKENLNMQLLGKMMESGWKDDWEYLSKRLDDERVKRFAADKENSQTKMSLRAAERELQQEKRMRAELCQLIRDVAAEGDVAALSRDLEEMRAIMSALDASTNALASQRLEHLEACALVIHTKVSVSPARAAPNLAVDSEGLSEQARVFALEEELAATRARQATLHELLRKMVEDKVAEQDLQALALEDTGGGGFILNESQAAGGGGGGSGGEMASQSLKLVWKLFERNRASRACCRRFHAAFVAINQGNVARLTAELKALDDALEPTTQTMHTPHRASADALQRASANVEAPHEHSLMTHLRLDPSEYAGVVREYPELLAEARALFKASLQRAVSASSDGGCAGVHDEQDEADWRMVQRFVLAAVASTSADHILHTARAVRSHLESVVTNRQRRGNRAETAATIDCMRATAQLIESKSLLLRSSSALRSSEEERDKAAAHKRDLERTARLQLSAFVRDISLVQDVDFLRSRLAALQAKVAKEQTILQDATIKEKETAAHEREHAVAHAHEREHAPHSCTEASPTHVREECEQVWSEMSLSRQMVNDMESCVLLLQDKVSLLEHLANGAAMQASATA